MLLVVLVLHASIWGCVLLDLAHGSPAAGDIPFGKVFGVHQSCIPDKDGKGRNLQPLFAQGKSSTVGYDKKWKNLKATDKRIDKNSGLKRGLTQAHQVFGLTDPSLYGAEPG